MFRECMMGKIVHKFGLEDKRSIEFCRLCESLPRTEEATQKILTEFYKVYNKPCTCSRCEKETTELYEVENGRFLCKTCNKMEQIKDERDWE